MRMNGLTQEQWIEKAKISAEKHNATIHWDLINILDFLPLPYAGKNGETLWADPIYPWEK